MQRLYDDLGLLCVEAKNKTGSIAGRNLIGQVAYRTLVLRTHWILVS